ncbi:MAG: helix-turn-helix domain-containing protein [Chloroflexi bacterium]|nr:helix-turn-helix domain-containing protein [Chloroflexota bacterium]
MVAPVVARSHVTDPPLSLGPASRLLGVDPDTLRRWADEGRIEAFTTAGGHRRFARSTVERILEARRHDATQRLADLGATTDRLSRAYRRGYSAGAEAGDVLAAIPTGERDGFRDGGRKLVAALLEHLDAADDTARVGAETAAVAATDQLTGHLAEAGIALDEAVSLFVAARRPFLTELGAIARRRALDPDRLIAIYDSSSSLLDRLLIRLVSRYPRSGSSRPPIDPGRSTPAARATRRRS